MLSSVGLRAQEAEVRTEKEGATSPVRIGLISILSPACEMTADPRRQAEEYLESHKIPQLFEVRMASLLSLTGSEELHWSYCSNEHE